jgi:hypothetical protein
MDYSAPAACQRRRPPLLRAACQRWRPPLHQRLASGGDHLSVFAMARRPSPLSSYGGDDKTIQARDRHLHGVRRLVQPPGRRRSSVACGGRWRKGRCGCSGPAHGATVARAVDGQPRSAWRQEAALEAAPKPSKPKRWSRNTARFPPQRVGGARDGAVAQPAVHLHKAGEHPFPRMLEEEAGRSVASTDIPRR